MRLYLIIFFAFFMACLLFTTCNKDSSATSAAGQVIDATTQNAVPNATVYIQKRNTNCFGCNAGTFAIINADGSGNFSYSFNADKGYAYSVAAAANNYFDNLYTGGVGIDSYKSNNIKVPLQPKAWLKLHIKNATPYDFNDHIGISGVWGSPIQLYGMNIDTVFSGPVNGNTTNSVNWGVIKNNITNNYSGLPYFTAFDTTLYNINY